MNRRQFLKTLPLIGLGAAGITAVRYWPALSRARLDGKAG